MQEGAVNDKQAFFYACFEKRYSLRVNVVSSYLSLDWLLLGLCVVCE